MSITTNQPAVVDEDSYSVHRSIRIAAAVGKVWEAVTVPELISRWFEHTELDGDTQLTVVETGFAVTSDAVANMSEHQQGWTYELDKLVALLESGS